MFINGNPLLLHALYSQILYNTLNFVLANIYVWFWSNLSSIYGSNLDVKHQEKKLFKQTNST